MVKNHLNILSLQPEETLINISSGLGYRGRHLTFIESWRQRSSMAIATVGYHRSHATVRPGGFDLHVFFASTFNLGATPAKSRWRRLWVRLSSKLCRLSHFVSAHHCTVQCALRQTNCASEPKKSRQVTKKMGASDDFGRFRSTSVGFGRLRLTSVDFSARFCPALVFDS